MDLIVQNTDFFHHATGPQLHASRCAHISDWWGCFLGAGSQNRPVYRALHVPIQAHKDS